jgi:SPP1 family predicted phage head-tail adaptor
MDRRVTLQSRTVSRDATGAGIETFATLATVWAERRNMAGREQQMSGSETAMADAVYRIRWRTGIQADMRVVEGAATWDVFSVNEIGRREGLELTCSRVRP